MAHGQGVDTAGAQIRGNEHLGVGETSARPARRLIRRVRRSGDDGALVEGDEVAEIALLAAAARGLLLFAFDARGRGEGGEDLGLALLGGVAGQGDGVDALGGQVLGHLFGGVALVDEDEHALDGVGGFGVVVHGFADRPDDVGAGEVAVATVGFFVDVDDAELDAAGDGVQFGGDEAGDGGEALVEEGVEAAGDGGGAEDELLQGGGDPVDDSRGCGREGAVEEGVGFVDDEVGDAAEDVGVFFCDAGD